MLQEIVFSAIFHEFKIKNFVIFFSFFIRTNTNSCLKNARKMGYPVSVCHLVAPSNSVAKAT